MAQITVGEVTSSDTGCFQWTIDNFLSKVWKESITLYSPLLTFSESSYCLYLNFSGTHKPLRLSFRKVYYPPLDNLNVKLAVRTGYRGEIETRRGKMVKGIFEVDTWMPWSEFLQNRREILRNGRLTIICELRRSDMEGNAPVLQEKLSSEEKATVKKEAFERDSVEQDTCAEEESTQEGKTLKSDSAEVESISKWKTFKKLQKDFKNLLISGEDSDVTIKVQGKEFPAHRGILRSRSPVFKSMLSHNMVEKHSGVVVIDDCDPATFLDFLNYFYTGSTKHICHENVFSLYTASDKYCVEELKEECAAFIESHLSVGTFCDTITVALRHTEKQLIHLATEFFCANATEIIKTVKWQTFLLENTAVGNELFLKVLSKRN